jgi:kumamolisin
MPEEVAYVHLPNSEHHGPTTAVAMPLSAEQQELVIKIDMIVRRRPSGPPFPHIDQIGAQPIRERRYLSHDEFDDAYGADPADFAAVADFGRQFGLTVVESNLSTRIVTLSGTLSSIGAALRVNITYMHDGPRQYRTHHGQIQVPVTLKNIVLCVLGIDEYVFVHPMVQTVSPWEIALLNLYTQVHTPDQVADFYDLPEATGKGECISMVEFGGGYSLPLLNLYFALLGKKTPEITDVPIAGGANRPGLIPYLDAEVYLDIEVAGAIAPEAQLVVYFAPSSVLGFVRAFSAAIHDRVHNPSVVFCTWGFAEVKWMVEPGGMQAVNEVLQEAALLGVSVCVASGDWGATAGVFDGLPHVYFPASSPAALCVGGTTLYSQAAQIALEHTWNRAMSGGGASTGGYSEYFPLPPYQKEVPNPSQTQIVQPEEFQSISVKHGRAVPDVAALGDPTTGYLILMDGGFHLTAGTSAAAPLWSALIARLNQLMGVRMGYINPLLYSGIGSSGAFRNIVLGNNLFYNAGPGWNPCTGWGTPDGKALLKALQD